MDNQSVILQPKDYIKITLHSIKFHHGDVKIKAIGFIDDLASSDEKEKFYSDEFVTPEKSVDFETYIAEPISPPFVPGNDV